MDTLRKPDTQNKNKKEVSKLTTLNKLNDKSKNKGKKEHLP
jgi:hypothetical protein